MFLDRRGPSKRQEPVYVARQPRGGMGRDWNDNTGFEPPVSAEDTGKIFGKQAAVPGSRPRPEAPGFMSRDPPLAEFFAARSRKLAAENKVKEAEKQENEVGTC